MPPELQQEPFLTVFLTGALSPEALRRVVRDELQQRLVAVEGMARVTMLGGRREVLTVELDRSRACCSMQEYTVTVSWDYQGPSRLAGEYERQVHDAFRPPPGFSVQRDAKHLVTEDESRMLAYALAGAVLVMFMMLAVLYESLWLPFIVLATIPLALVGVCYLYVWTGASFTSSGYIGVILLVGIVDNTACCCWTASISSAAPV